MHGWCSYRYYCNEATYTQQAYYIMNGTVFLFHQLAMVISLAYSQLITIASTYSICIDLYTGSYVSSLCRKPI